MQAGLELPVNPAVASPRQYHYRSKITPHFDKPKEGGKPAIGFLKAGSRRDVVDVPQCPIAMECINEALPLARKSVYQAAAGSNGEPPFCSGPRKEPSSPITMPSPANGWAIWNSIFWRETFSRIILSFFRFLRITWPNRRVWTGRNSWWTPTAVPAWFALSLAKKFKKVLGVEVSETSADWARSNARSNGIEHAEFLAADAGAIFAGWISPRKKPPW